MAESGVGPNEGQEKILKRKDECLSSIKTTNRYSEMMGSGRRGENGKGRKKEKKKWNKRISGGRVNTTPLIGAYAITVFVYAVLLLRTPYR
jgi:hypothetical protein